ncbi:tRNA preQ1(34) S-adenosylmethionine ribosyltransferase-isomerase QueA [Patescibacteria group bacterium]|nr:tRNA preQ1(34) S-adenosylmethionine ribosyltransferase-isomerase QueA [Patescibacteria group bacterium]MBU1613032.1 tRNA preQ1(34) S-adenosylmethionine ribosyltransferase-isomerase QueA [Patescibacteria group bacterium]
MLTSDFDYNLPENLIAQQPAEPRDSSRLMVVDRKEKTIDHRHFFDIVNYLRKGDLLVWNNTKVFKARLRGKIEVDENVIDDEKNGGEILNTKEVEIFLVRPMENLGVWKVLAKPARKLRLGMKVRFADDFAGEILLKEKDGTILMQFGDDDMGVRAKANKYGEVPTPPYVGSQPATDSSRLEKAYQTVYAKKEGSVAAPTAGFHFTPELIEKLEKMGVRFAEVTLHVGLGTFLPVKTEKVEEHKMHAEWAEITDKNASLIEEAKAEGRRVVAVGTTTVRTLEGVYKKFGKIQPFSGDVNLFILPGFKFEAVDALITNFHLPKSTLIMLVSAFAGDKQFITKCYEEAVKEKYRFYSFGDAMFIM